MTSPVRSLVRTLVVVAAALPGCGAVPTATDRAAPAPSAVSDPDADGALDALERLVGRDHGVAIRRVRVVDTGDAIGVAIAAHALPSPLEPELEARLARSGIRVALLPMDAIEAVLASLGKAALDSEDWHGEAVTWRPLTESDLRGGMRVVAVDGRVRRLVDGRLRLDFRGWTLMTEHGPRTQVELMPLFDRSRRTSIDRSLGRGGFEGERWRSLRVELELEPGTACLVTTDRAGASWSTDAVVAVETRRDRGLVPGGDPSGLTDAELGVVPAADGTGPSVAAPPTLGDLLLAVPTVPRTRDLFLVLPRQIASPEASS